MKPYYCGVQTSKCWQNRGGVICLPCTRISSAGPLSGGRVSLHRFVNPKYQGEEFPGGPGVKTLCFHCRRRRLNPWLENLILALTGPCPFLLQAPAPSPHPWPGLSTPQQPMGEQPCWILATLLWSILWSPSPRIPTLSSLLL